jgi:hypothetical protein
VTAFILAKVESGKDEEVLKKVRKLGAFNVQALHMAYTTCMLRFLLGVWMNSTNSFSMKSADSRELRKH